MKRTVPPTLWLSLGLVALVVLVAVGAFLLGRSSGPSAARAPSARAGVSSNKGSLLQALPPVDATPQPMDVPDAAAPTALWVDVYAPAKVREALAKNAWVQQQLARPLGQGFVGGWAAFLGTRGEDLGAEFKDTVLDVVAGQVLAGPFRVLWFSSDERTGTPAVLVPAPGRAAVAAFESLSAVAHRNALSAAGCPGGTGTAPQGGFTLERWLVAEQALWAARTDDRLVFGRHPSAVLQALCVERPALRTPDGVDVEVGFAPEPLGRELQALTHVLGLGHTTLRFAVEGDRLVGKGITGEVVAQARLDAAPFSDDLLKLVPEVTPVLLAVQLKLPEALEPEALKAFWSGKGPKVPTRTRQVALVWTPRGDAEAPTEVALLWGRPEDGAALLKLFSGPNPLDVATLCGHQVLASTPEVLARLRKTCEGKWPSLLNAPAPVVRALREKGSVAFNVNTGRLLSGLLADGQGGKPGRAAPPEVEAARRDLETLPYVGLRGTVQGNTLVPGGFGS